jgi:hypothetical protein
LGGGKDYGSPVVCRTMMKGGSREGLELFPDIHWRSGVTPNDDKLLSNVVRSKIKVCVDVSLAHDWEQRFSSDSAWQPACGPNPPRIARTVRILLSSGPRIEISKVSKPRSSRPKDSQSTSY